MTAHRSLDLVKELERSRYFRGVPETLLHPLSVHAEIVRFGDGDVFAALGSPPDALYVILGGKVDVLRKTGHAGTLTKVSELQSGMLVGHVSVLRDKPRQASYRAQGVVHLARFPREAVHKLLEDEGVVGSTFRRALIMALSNHLLAANRKLTGFLGDDAPMTPTQTQGRLQDLHVTLGSGDG